MTDSVPNASQKTSANRLKIGLFALVATIGVVAYFQYGELLTLQNLAQREADLRAFQTENPLLVYGAAFAIYVFVTALSLPGATGMTLLIGWYLGFLRAIVLVSFASTIGATLAFLLSRFILRDAIESRFGDRLTAFNDALRREGAFYLFTLRLIPAVPFFVINIVMGLTPLRAATFYAVSQIGMLPGTCVYVYAGSVVPDLQTLADQGIQAVFTPSQVWQLLFAFALLGVFPLAAKKLIRLVQPSPALADTASSTDAS